MRRNWVALALAGVAISAIAGYVVLAIKSISATDLILLAVLATLASCTVVM